MEVVVASLLTWFDHPKEVRGNWGIRRNDRPNHVAPAGYPDLVFYPMDVQPPFQIVCEVSANLGLDETSFRTQLEGALRHCDDYHLDQGDGVTYGFLVNHARMGEDEKMQTVYRSFVNDKENKLLDPEGPVRLVPMRNGDFGSVLRRLYAEGELAFDARLFAKALDALHVRLRGDIPTGAMWMIDVFVETIKAGMQGQQDLFDSEAAGEG